MPHNPTWLVSASVLPVSSTLIQVIVHPDVMQGHLSSGNLSALGQFSGLLRGNRMLELPDSIFKGLKRPLHSDGVDNFVFVYSCAPTLTYAFSRHERGGPVAMPAPANSVFVTFVSLSRAVVAEVQQRLGTPDALFRGVILGWEWTLREPGSPMLPINHAKRYKRRIWIRS